MCVKSSTVPIRNHHYDIGNLIKGLITVYSLQAGICYRQSLNVECLREVRYPSINLVLPVKMASVADTALNHHSLTHSLT